MKLRNQSAAGAGFPVTSDASALVLPVIVDALLKVVVNVFVDVHVCSGSERSVTGHVLEIVRVGYRVVYDGRADAGRILEVKRIVGARSQRIVVRLG